MQARPVASRYDLRVANKLATTTLSGAK